MALFATDLVRVALLWRPDGAAQWAGEEAVTTFWLRLNIVTGTSFDWPTDLGNLPGQLHTKFVAHWTDACARVHSNECHIRQIKCSHIDTAGHDLDVAALDITDDSLQGQQTTGMLPPEVALCVSSWSYTPGGFTTHKGRKRGRFYLPYVASAMNNGNGVLTDINAGNVATDYQGLMNDIQGMHTDPDLGDLAHWDYVTVSGIDGTWHNVDHVSVDNHFDSQRRRQHQATPTRFVRDITHS